MSIASEHLSCAGWRDHGFMKTHEIYEYWGGTKWHLTRNYLRDFLTRMSGCRDFPPEADQPAAENPGCLGLQVGMPGFEPGTSCAQGRRASRAALHPEFRMF